MAELSPGRAPARAHGAIAVGDELPPLTTSPVTRLQLALFAGAGADHNPIHVDDAAARAGGLPGAIVHGMLTMAFLGRLLTGWTSPDRIRSLSARFVAMAFPGDAITCTGRIIAIEEIAGERRAEIELAARNQQDVLLLSGSARVHIPVEGRS